MSVPFVDTGRQYRAYKKEIDAAFESVATSGLYVQGEAVEEFEQKLAEFCEVSYCLTVANGTDALILAMRVLGIGVGDEVITTPNSFIASAGSIAAVGAIPVFVDVREDYNINPDKIVQAITGKTRAIMPVHLTGRPAAMNKINAIAKEYGLVVIEDAAQAIGAKYKGRPVGGLGDIGCFSLHPLKNLSVMGDGGFVTTNNKDCYQGIKLLKNHGLLNRNECIQWGFNSRLDSLHCAIGLAKIKHLDAITKKLREIARIYRENLSDIVDVPQDKNGEYAVYHNFVIGANEREKLYQFLQKKKIGCAIHYPILLHLQQAAKNLGYTHGDFPVAERINKRQLSLPIYPELREIEIEEIVDAIREYYN